MKPHSLSIYLVAASEIVSLLPVLGAMGNGAPLPVIPIILLLSSVCLMVMPPILNVRQRVALWLAASGVAISWLMFGPAAYFAARDIIQYRFYLPGVFFLIPALLLLWASIWLIWAITNSSPKGVTSEFHSSHLEP